MMATSLKTQRRRTSPGLLFAGILVAFTLLLAACGSSPTTGGTKASITPPNDLITPGTLTVGSDTTYAPQEFIDPKTGKAAGFDIDLITEMASRMGLQAKIVTTSFTTIVDDLVAKRFDVVISAQTITDERKKKVDFVPYFKAGESLLVPKGNPKNLKSVSDLCGLNVGVQDATVELDDLNAGTKTCKAAGKPAINLTVLKDQTAVIELLVNHRVDATYQDSPVTDYYLKQNPGQFDVGGSVVNTAVEGISVRKGDTSMLNAIQAAFNAVKADGTYHNFAVKWAVTAEEITLIDRRTIYS